MYKFIDVTETPEGALLPSEALKINGTYIEDLIPGYRTLTVEGREALSPEIATYDTGYRDGSLMSGKRYPARTIRVTYQLAAKTCEEFRECYNKLGAILDVTDAELIFEDEQDKYFIGTPSRIGEVPPGRNSVIGEFDLLCLDPFKYSVAEYTASASPGDPCIFIDYNGTYKSFPKLQAEFHAESEASEDGENVVGLTGKGECGYVAFFNESEKIVQLGDPEEVDGEEGAFSPSQTLINTKLDTKNGWGSAAKSQWSVNSGFLTSAEYGQGATIDIGEASPAKSGTSGTSQAEKWEKVILNVTSKADVPYMHYVVRATATKRTKTSVSLNISVDVRLNSAGSYFGKGYNLTCRARIKGIGASKTATLKGTNEEWRGTEFKRQNMTFTVTIPESETIISNITFEAYRLDSTGGKAGTVSETVCESITIPAYVAPTSGVSPTYYLTAKSYGSGDGWHGSTITRNIPKDAAGASGAQSFELSFASKMAIGSTNQRGAFRAIVASGVGTGRAILAGLNVVKSGNGISANVEFYVGGALKETVEISLAGGNKYFNKNSAVKITKQGNRVTFAIGSAISKTYIDEAIADEEASEVTFAFLKHGTVTPLSYNGLYWVQFVKNYCETWRDIPNKFKANDIVEADCRTGAITLNGVAAWSLGALGNDYEDFYLTPGLNQIGASYSEWVEAGYEPTFKVKYREVYL